MISADTPEQSENSLESKLISASGGGKYEIWHGDAHFSIVGSVIQSHVHCSRHVFQVVVRDSQKQRGVNVGFLHSFCDDSCHRIRVLHVLSHHALSFQFQEYLLLYYRERHAAQHFVVAGLRVGDVYVLGLLCFGREHLDPDQADDFLFGLLQPGFFRGLRAVVRHQLSSDEAARARMRCINTESAHFKKDFGVIETGQEPIVSVLTEVFGYTPVYAGSRIVSFVREIENHCVCKKSVYNADNVQIDIDSAVCGSFNDCMLQEIGRQQDFICSITPMSESTMETVKQEVKIVCDEEDIATSFEQNRDSITSNVSQTSPIRTNTTTTTTSNQLKKRKYAYLYDSIDQRRKGGPRMRVPAGDLVPSSGVQRMGVLVPRPPRVVAPRPTLKAIEKQKRAAPLGLEEAISAVKQGPQPEQPVPRGCTRQIPTPLQFQSRASSVIPVASPKQSNFTSLDYAQCNRGNAYHPCGDKSSPSFVPLEQLQNRRSTTLHSSQQLLMAAWAVDMVRLTNKYRALYDQPPVQWDSRQAEIGYPHSRAMGQGIEPFEHGGFDARARSVPYAQAGVWENLAQCNAAGQQAETMVEGWIRSPPHRKALQSNSTHCGIGIYQNREGVYYATQLFAKQT